jgi:hypothetical protein
MTTAGPRSSIQESSSRLSHSSLSWRASAPPSNLASEQAGSLYLSASHHQGRWNLQACLSDSQQHREPDEPGRSGRLLRERCCPPRTGWLLRHRVVHPGTSAPPTGTNPRPPRTHLKPSRIRAVRRCNTDCLLAPLLEVGRELGHILGAVSLCVAVGARPHGPDRRNDAPRALGYLES